MKPTDFPQGYRPRHLLGEGSMGTVWLAYSGQARGHCAVKVLHLRDDRKGSAERSFNREVRAMARLRHPAVIEILDYGRTPQGSPFVAMEYVPGVSLSQYMLGGWTWPRLYTLLDALLAGLAHAHARDLVHRDLKPGNVLVIPHQASGGIKLVDFGIALAVNEAQTASRRIEGTPAYIAPEAASGEVAAIGPWTDLYSLGVMLFELVTGELPFHGRHLLAHHQRTPLPPVRIRADVSAPAGLVPIIERLLAKVPLHRYRTVAEVREALWALGPAPEFPVALGEPPEQFTLDEEDTRSTMGEDDVAPAVGPSGPGLFFLREPALAGRTAQQAVIREAAEAALMGDGPRVVLIEGDAGLGKSSLAAWAREWLEEGGLMRTLIVRSEPHTRTGGGLRQAILRYVGLPTASRTDAEQALDLVFPEADARQNALDVLFSIQDASDQASEAHIARAARLVRDLAGEQPFLFWADDAQWSPEGKVLRLVHRLARGGADAARRLLIIVTLRPSSRTTVRAARKALMALPRVDHLELGPVGPLELAPALDALAPLPDGVATAACLQAAGNPLIALEAVRGYLEDAGLHLVPTDPNAVLQARIDGVTKGEGGGALRSALARATLLGRSFTVGPLARLCTVPGDPEAPDLPVETAELEGLLEKGVSAGLAIEQGAGRWRFSHDLVRGQLRQVCRQLPNWPELNEMAAELKLAKAEQDPTGIELEVVARHYAEAGQMSHALRLGRESVRRLHVSGLMGHATSFTRRLLEWDDFGHLLSAEDRGELCLLASESAEHAGQPHEAETYTQQAVGIAQRNYLFSLAARAASRLGVLRVRADRTDDAETWLTDALRFARRSGDAVARSNAHLSLGHFYQHLGRLEQARAAFEASLESARGAENRPAELAARLAMAHLDRLEGRLARAEDEFTELAELAAECSLEVNALTARLELGVCAWTRNDAHAARGQFEEVRQAAHGNLFAIEFYAALGEAWAQGALGHWGEVELLLIQAEDLRYDVRMHDAEAERLRRALRELALTAARHDLVERIDRLNILQTRTHSTTQGAEITRP
jgi:tetratricopeptide (TPR) repeat protein